MTPTRIAHVIGKMRNGGVESVVMNYYRNIDRNKIQYDFIIDGDSENPELEQEIKNLGGRIITVPPYQKQLSYQRELRKIFRENQYKLVYSHINTLSVFPLMAAKSAGVPIRVAHNHSTAGRGKGEFLRNIMNILYGHLQKFIRLIYARVQSLRVNGYSGGIQNLQFGRTQ